MDDQLRALLAEAVRDANLKSSDIPSIDLYLDQILSIVADAQREGAPHFAERALTGTMINNYSKDGLIKPVKGKKYTKEHIIEMLLVYTLKNTLSMTEIKRILSDAYEKELPLTECYDRFIGNKQDDRARGVEAVAAMIADHEYDMTSDADYFSALLEVCLLSDYFRCMAQAMLCDRYPALVDRAQLEKEEKQQMKAAAKAAAKQQKKATKAKQSADEKEEVPVEEAKGE